MTTLKKNKWKIIPIGKLSEIQYGSSFKSSDDAEGYKTFRMNEIVNGIAIDNGKMKKTRLNSDEFKKYKLNYGDILFNRTNSYEHVGRTGIFTNEHDEYMFASYLLRVAVDRTYIDPFFLNTLMNSTWFQSNIKKYATKAVGQANINATSLAAFAIPVPSLEEQARINSLFQSMEHAIEQAEKQGNNLADLKKYLSNGVISKRPVFGKLLNESNSRIETFGNAVDCIEQHDKQKKDVSRFIGLENIESDNLKISTWGNIADGTTFTKRFCKGDVLFGKRRAYLKKVAVADFDGICSGDILVLRSKSKVMLPGLLPYYASSDAFINHAVSTSAGSLSPRTKWRDLSEFKFSVPDLKVQKVILEVFEQIENGLNQAKSQKDRLLKLKHKLLHEILE